MNNYSREITENKRLLIRKPKIIISKSSKNNVNKILSFSETEDI